MRFASKDQFLEIAVLTLLAFGVLWKGGKTLESTWLLLAIAACAVMYLYWKRMHEPKAEKSIALSVMPMLLIFLLLSFLSLLFSSTQNYGLDEVLRDGGLIFLLYWVMERREASRASARHPLLQLSFEEQFILLITTITVLCCAVGVIVYALQPVNRFVGTFFDFRFHTDYWPNAFAEFLLLAWPVVLLQAGKRIERGSLTAIQYYALDKILRFVPIGMVIGCLLLTYSRGALIAFIGQIALLTMLLWSRRTVGNRLKAPLQHIVASLLIGFAVFAGANEMRSFLHPIQPVSEKIAFGGAEGRSSVDERASFWKASALLTLHRPIFGWGPYSFRFVQPRYQKSVLATSDHPHNVFFKLSAERGIPAAVLFGIFLYVVFYRGVYLALSGKRFLESADPMRLGYTLLTVSIAGVIAHNLIDYNLQFVGISMPLWIMIGMVLRHGPMLPFRRITHSWFTPERIRTLAALSAALLLVIAVREGWYLLTSSAGRHAEAAGNRAEALEWYARSKGEWFSRDLHLSRTHLLLAEGNTDEAAENLTQYLDHNDEDARAWKLKGEIAMEENNFEEAITAYEKAFFLGSWNDLGISRGLLEALFAETYMQPTSDAAADSKRLILDPRIADFLPLIEDRVRNFALAIEQNTHFVALSPNPEEAVKILIILGVLKPDLTDEYQALMESIETKAAQDRGKMKARAPGWLW